MCVRKWRRTKVQAHGEVRMDFPTRRRACETMLGAEAAERMGRQPYGVRWIGCNKEPRRAKQDGGAGTRRTSIIEIEYMLVVTSSTPPELVRVQPSLTMSMRGGKGELLVIQLLDASSGSSALRRVTGPHLREKHSQSSIRKGSCACL